MNSFRIQEYNNNNNKKLNPLNTKYNSNIFTN
jgi:hypothetical protein